jgi:hypothetical protein
MSDRAGIKPERATDLRLQRADNKKRKREEKSEGERDIRRLPGRHQPKSANIIAPCLPSACGLGRGRLDGRRIGRGEGLPAPPEIPGHSPYGG